MMKQLARLQFSSFQIKVPQGWSPPSGDPAARHYSDAFTPQEKSTSPAVAAPPLVLPQSMNKYHTDSQKMHHAKIGSFIDGVCDAVCSAWSAWAMEAKLMGVVVTTSMAMGGQVVSAIQMGPMIIAQGPKSTPMEAKFTKAVANAFSMQWNLYTLGIKVMGMPWYPPYVAPLPPGPAPPAPNVPCPLKAISTASMALSKNALKPLMIANLADPQAPFHKELFDAVSTAIEQSLLTYETTTMVKNVMPIAAAVGFPVGPVAGVANMIPGGFA